MEGTFSIHPQLGTLLISADNRNEQPLEFLKFKSHSISSTSALVSFCFRHSFIHPLVITSTQPDIKTICNRDIRYNVNMDIFILYTRGINLRVIWISHLFLHCYCFLSLVSPTSPLSLLSLPYIVFTIYI